MTKQETFDTVVAHLRKQGQQAIIKENENVLESCREHHRPQDRT